VVQLSTIGKGSENFTLHVSNPDNTTAEVWVPSKENGTVTQNGKSINAIAGLKLNRLLEPICCNRNRYRRLFV
jgi:hypothetical protein